MNIDENLQVKTISSVDDSKVLDKIYALYEKCFPLEEERVAKETFEYILNRNNDERDAKYFVSYIEDKEGNVIGGAAYDVFKGCCDDKYAGTAHLSFMFVDEDHRGKKYEDLLAEDIKKNCKEFCGEQPVLCFAESNAVGRMNIEQYQKDKSTGTDPATRRHLGELKGFKTLDIPYIQPALEAGQDACNYLDLLVFDDKKKLKNISSSIIKQHLNRFFEDLFPIEGTSLEMQGLEQTNNFLNNNNNVSFIDVGRQYSKMKKDIENLAENSVDKLQTIYDLADEQLKSKLNAVDTHRNRQHDKAARIEL